MTWTHFRRCVVLGVLCAAVVGFESRASAEMPRLRAPRLSIGVAAPNVVLYAIAGGVLFADAAGRDSKSERNTSLGLASAYTALFGLNLGWIVEAGGELNARLDRVDDHMSPKTARIGTAFSSIDTAARLGVLATGIALLTTSGGGLTRTSEVGAGVTLVVTNSLLLPFHVWALVVHSKELRWRKRGVDPYAVRRLHAVPGGFRF